MSGHRLVDYLRKRVQDVGPEHHIHIREAFADTLGNMFLLHHAAAYPYQHVRILLLIVLERAEVTENAILGVLPDCAGVEQHQIRAVRRVRESVSHIRQHSLYLFAVAHILLAAEAVDMRHRRLLPGAVQLPDLPGVFFLCR